MLNLASAPVQNTFSKRMSGLASDVSGLASDVSERASELAASVSERTSDVSFKVPGLARRAPQRRKRRAVAGAAATGRRAGTTGRQAARTARRVAGTGAKAAATGARVGLSAAAAAQRIAPPARETPSAPKLPVVTAAAAAGAGVVYLLDPADGKRRRTQLRDQTLAATRRLARRGGQQARYAQGKAQGAAHAAQSAVRGGAEATPTPDDRTLADRVRTEIFRRPNAPKGAVNVTAVDGIVHLRGEVEDPVEIERLVQDARNVPGVRAVENLLHQQGAAAPTGGRA